MNKEELLKIAREVVKRLESLKEIVEEAEQAMTEASEDVLKEFHADLEQVELGKKAEGILKDLKF